MKTLLVKPGVGIVEKTLRGPWTPELSYLEKLYREPGLLFRGFISLEGFSHSPTLAVGTVLRKLGEDVEYLDVPFEFGLPLTEKLNAEKQEKIEKYIGKGEYDVVGISCTSTLEGVTTRQIAEAARSASEDVNIVVGGYQAASDALTFMERVPAIDCIVLSDFECVGEKLYESFNGKIPMREVPNILYRKNGTIYASERVHLKVSPEDLPVYDYTLAEKYLPKYTMFMIEASRGCPYNCSFCQEKVLRHSYTVKDASTAANEIIDTASYLAQFVDNAIFFYCDPLWGANPKWVKRFCSHVIKRRDETGSDLVGWGAAARVGQFSSEELSLMKRAGCITVGYGVESLSPRMLRIMDKTVNPGKYVDSVSDTVDKTLEADLHVILTFILGLPGETPSTMKETLNSLKNLPLGNRNLHLQIGLPVALRQTLLDQQLHDPKYIEEYGIRVHDEYDWEKGYLPRFTPLFDPSRELSASELADIFLDLIHGIRGISGSLGKKRDTFREISTVLEKEYISPEELAEWGRIYRKIVMEGS